MGKYKYNFFLNNFTFAIYSFSYQSVRISSFTLSKIIVTTKNTQQSFDCNGTPVKLGFKLSIRLVKNMKFWTILPCINVLGCWIDVRDIFLVHFEPLSIE